MTKPPRQFTLLFLIVTLLSASHAWAPPIAQGAENFIFLFDAMEAQKLEEPLVLLTDKPGIFDQERHQENLAFLNRNKQFLQEIKAHFNSDRLDWKLAGSSRRLLVVPEQREDFAALFERYCQEAVEHTLTRTRLPNPYQKIATVVGPVTVGEGRTPTGIAAYLVHNIAEEYIEEFHFFNQAAVEDSKIKLELRNRVFSGKIGSYSSRLTIGQNDTIEWTHEKFTLWQNTAQDPMNVLVAPIEETLHIALRTVTTGAIEENLARMHLRNLQEVQRVVDTWMAVEEALVGGLVAQLMPEIFVRLLSGPLQKELAQSLADRDAHPQYRYLQKGIRVVMDLGLLPAIALYQAEPMAFKRLISNMENGLLRGAAPSDASIADDAAEQEPVS